MQATITYLLTEQAQRAAIKATGLPVTREQTMTIEVLPDDLDLFDIDKEGLIKLDLTSAYSPWAEALRLGGWLATTTSGWEGKAMGAAANIINPPLIEDYRRGIQLLAIRQAEQKILEETNGQHNRELAERAFQAFLADPGIRSDDRINETVEDLTGEELKKPATWFPSDHAGFKAEIKRRRALEEETRKAAAKAEEEAREAKAKAKADYIDFWIVNNASPAIQEQHANGLLTRADALALIANAAFDELGVPGAHKVHLCQDESCPCSVKDVDGLPPAVYASWAAQLLNLLPEDATVEFEKARDCECDPDGYHDTGDGAGEPYYTALIRLPVGPFVFQRRIKS